MKSAPPSTIKLAQVYFAKHRSLGVVLPFGLISVIMLGLVVALYMVGGSTELRQQASGGQCACDPNFPDTDGDGVPGPCNGEHFNSGDRCKYVCAGGTWTKTSCLDNSVAPPNTGGGNNSQPTTGGTSQVAPIQDKVTSRATR